MMQLHMIGLLRLKGYVKNGYLSRCKVAFSNSLTFSLQNHLVLPLPS